MCAHIQCKKETKRLVSRVVPGDVFQPLFRETPGPAPARLQLAKAKGLKGESTLHCMQCYPATNFGLLLQACSVGACVRSP